MFGGILFQWVAWVSTARCKTLWLFHCRYWGSRKCFNGMGCPFAHSESELCEKPSLQATGLCYEYAKTGRCRKGQACNFAHGQHELRSFPPAKKASVPPVSSVASMASPCGPPQNTRLDSEIAMQIMMVNQLRKVEEMMARMTLELRMASATSQGLHTPPHNLGDPVDSSKAQRSQSELKSIWLWGIVFETRGG